MIYGSAENRRVSAKMFMSHIQKKRITTSVDSKREFYFLPALKAISKKTSAYFLWTYRVEMALETC